MVKFSLLLATGCGLNAVKFHVKDWSLVHEEGYSYHIAIFNENDEGLTIPLRKKETLNTEQTMNLSNIKEISLVKILGQPRARSRAAMESIAIGVFFQPNASWEELAKTTCINLHVYQFNNKYVTPKLFVSYDM